MNYESLYRQSNCVQTALLQLQLTGFQALQPWALTRGGLFRAKAWKSLEMHVPKPNRHLLTTTSLPLPLIYQPGRPVARRTAECDQPEKCSDNSAMP
jgi:hypothetical protein